MKISGISKKDDGVNTTLSADCNGFNLYYRFPSELGVRVSADPFVAACLLSAMSTGSDVCIQDDVPVSLELLENLEELQAIFALWEVQLGHKLTPVKILGGKRVSTSEEVPKLGVASFFSGGVDGSYTFLKHEDEIDLLIFSKGIDIQLSNGDLFDEAHTRNKDYLQKHDKPLHVCETNVRYLGFEYGLNWTVCFGGGLSSIALAAGVSRCFIASGHSYAATIQEGSNYVTDHLWSNGVTRILHDGAEASRPQKIKRLSNALGALDILRVCWHDRGYNCGECEKCLRTMVALRLLDLKTESFPELIDSIVKSKVAKLKIYNAPNFRFLEENLALAEEVGDMVVLRALRRVRRSFLFRHHAGGLLSAFN